MGGKLSSRRMVNEYSVLCLSILDSINSRDVYIPRHIENKTSFGDIDIYVKKDSMSFDDIANLMSKSKLFEIKDIFKSTNQIVIHSDEFDIDVQVDINFIKNWNFRYWYDFGVMSALIGQIIPYEMKFASNGLFLRKTDNMIEYPIKLKFEDALAFLGFNEVIFRGGFKTEEEMLNWLTSSKYFNKVDLLHNPRNSGKRKRDENRGVDKFIEKMLHYPDKGKFNFNKLEPYKRYAYNMFKSVQKMDYEIKRIKKWCKTLYIAPFKAEQLAQKYIVLNNASKMNNKDFSDFIIRSAYNYPEPNAINASIKYIKTEINPVLVKEYSDLYSRKDLLVKLSYLVLRDKGIKEAKKYIPSRILPEVLKLDKELNNEKQT
jgi:hypothetical protein